MSHSDSLFADSVAVATSFLDHIDRGTTRNCFLRWSKEVVGAYYQEGILYAKVYSRVVKVSLTENVSRIKNIFQKKISKKNIGNSGGIQLVWLNTSEVHENLFIIITMFRGANKMVILIIYIWSWDVVNLTRITRLGILYKILLIINHGSWTSDEKPEIPYPSYLGYFFAFFIASSKCFNLGLFVILYSGSFFSTGNTYLIGSSSIGAVSGATLPMK